MGVFIWTAVFLFVGVFIGYIIGDRLEMQKNEKILKDETRHTNADRIRNMSDEELAEFIHGLEVTCFADFIGYANKDCEQDKISCRDCRAKAPTILEWLQSEVKAEESEEK